MRRGILGMMFGDKLKAIVHGFGTDGLLGKFLAPLIFFY